MGNKLTKLKSLHVVLSGVYSCCISFYSMHDGDIYISRIVQYCYQKTRCCYCMQCSIHLSWLRSPSGNPCYKKEEDKLDLKCRSCTITVSTNLAFERAQQLNFSCTSTGADVASAQISFLVRRFLIYRGYFGATLL